MKKKYRWIKRAFIHDQENSWAKNIPMFFWNQLPNLEVFPVCLPCFRQRSTCMEVHHKTEQAANPGHAKYKFQSIPGMFQAPDWIPHRQMKTNMYPVVSVTLHPTLTSWFASFACAYSCVWWACMCVNMSVRMTLAAFPSHFPSCALSQNLSLVPRAHQVRLV